MLQAIGRIEKLLDETKIKWIFNEVMHESRTEMDKTFTNRLIRSISLLDNEAASFFELPEKLDNHDILVFKIAVDCPGAYSGSFIYHRHRRAMKAMLAISSSAARTISSRLSFFAIANSFSKLKINLIVPS